MTVERLLTLPEVAKELRVSVATLRGWRYSGRLKCVQLPGGSLRVRQAELDRILSNVLPAAVAPQQEGTGE